MPNRSMYAATTGLSAFLLFLVQPMLAKEMLPVFGGASAVWIACLVFFQLWLFAGYGYAHGLTRLRGRYQAGVHLAVVGAAALSLLWHPAALARAGAWPSLEIFFWLLRRLGLPYLALAATSPLLQSWWVRGSGRPVPWGLFALSNFASLLALLLYPWMIEPRFDLRRQFMAWSIGFAVFAVLVEVIAWRTLGADIAMETASGDSATTAGRRLLWVLLPMCSSMMLCATTTHLTENVAAIPLLWVLPLTIYLLSFIVTFEGERFYSRTFVPRLLAFMVASLGYALFRFGIGFPLLVTLPLFLLGLLAVCYFCHGELFRLRPAAGSPTGFYLYVAGGGALGAILAGVVAPAIFANTYELPLTLAFASGLALVVLWRQGWTARMLWTACAALMIYVPITQAQGYRFGSLAMVRSFYGSLRVTENHNPPGAVTSRHLFHGTIEHGMQIFSDAERREPTSYYARDSGVGLAMQACCNGRPRRVGAIGLGTGTIAAYGNPGDVFDFYEINPQVEGLARTFFTFLRDSAAKIRVVMGDGRLSLEAAPPQGYDIIVVDAFSGDAIPVHLLTREAMRVYLRHLQPGGIIAFHISNQHLDLAPEVALLAEDAGMRAIQIHSRESVGRGEFAADWVLVTKNPVVYLNPDVVALSKPIAEIPGLRLWTDNDNSLLPLLKVPVELLPAGAR